MKHSATTKTICLLLCLVLLTVALVGCQKKESYQPTDTLFLSTDASVRICYNDQGLVTDINAVNEGGTILCNAYSDYKNKSCSTVVQDLLKLSIEQNYLNENTKHVILVQTLGAKLPTESFLETIQADAASIVGDTASVILITQQQLTGDGFISIDTAQDLLKQYLGIGNFVSLLGDSSLLDRYGCYGFFVELEEAEHFYTVDAHTGMIALSNFSDYYGNLDDTPQTSETVSEAFTDPEFVFTEDPIPEIDPDLDVTFLPDETDPVYVPETTIDPASTEASYNISE